MNKQHEILRRLGSKFKVSIEITFRSKMRDIVRYGLLRRDKMWQDVITF